MAKIEKITAIPVRIPLRVPMKLASETIIHAENLIVRMTDSDGLEGWGEAASAPTMTGELLVGMVAAVERFIGPALVDAPLDDLQALQLKLDRSIRANSAAKAAVDVALHDLAGKREGRPVHCLLGQQRHKDMPVILMLSGQEPEALTGEILAKKNSGWSHFKLKVGAKPEADAELLRHLRKVSGPDIHLAADVNMAWDEESAIRFLNDVGEAGLAYLEQPLRDDDVTGMGHVAASSDIPICIDEAVHSVDDISKHQRHAAATGAGLKLIKLGGFRGTAEAERVARDNGWNTTYASKIAETSIGCAATLHAASLAKTVDWGVSLTTQYLTDDIVEQPIDLTTGRARISDTPGLGISVDEKQLGRYRIDQ